MSIYKVNKKKMCNYYRLYLKIYKKIRLFTSDFYVWSSTKAAPLSAIMSEKSWAQNLIVC